MPVSKRVTRKCLVCGTEKEFKESAIRNGRGKYCGTKCRDIANIGNSHARRENRKPHQKPEPGIRHIQGWQCIKPQHAGKTA